jgi:ribonuclease J
MSPKKEGGAPKKRSSYSKNNSSKNSYSNRNKRSGARNTQMKNGAPRRIATPIPTLKQGNIRIIPLGGVEEIGRNMTAIEIGDDIIVVDCGFGFGGEGDTPGVDYILPNTEYLETNRGKVRALFITHGHLDHIGGIPYIIDRIGNPTIYTRKLTGVMIKKRQEEFPHLPATNIREVEKGETIKVGKHTVRTFAVTHTIPDSMGIAIETPHGDIVITGDVKLDHTDGVVSKEEEKEFGIFKDRKVLCLLMDSTNTWKPGWSIPERAVFGTFEDIIPNAKGRLIIGTFASQLERLMKIVRITEASGKKIVVDGRSMVNNIGIVRELGILKHKDTTVIPISNMHEYPPEKIVILATGAQGDQYASLMRIANKGHKYIKLNPTDTIVLSSSVIPGNEVSVQKLKDNLSRQGAHIVTYNTSDVHASGHGSAEEAKWIHKQIKPKFFIPQHGHHFMLRVHADLIRDSIDIPLENIAIPDNSSIIEIQDGGKKIVKLKEKAPDAIRVVEGQSITELSGILMRDRKELSKEGFCVVVATIDRRTGKLHKSPDIISRGFVYLRENTELMNQTRLIISKQMNSLFGRGKHPNMDDAKGQLSDSVSRFLLQQTQKRPIVIPVIVSI